MQTDLLTKNKTMKKEELINKIGDVVMKNSKKGKLTTTKFVGTYNYKSGYDTYFAVSLDMNKVLVVYSYYQNDRGEHIDTPTYKLYDLPDKELQEVYKNLNIEDIDSLRYAAWSGIEEKNLAILTTLGIFRPKPVKNKIIFRHIIKGFFKLEYSFVITSAVISLNPPPEFLSRKAFLSGS